MLLCRFVAHRAKSRGAAAPLDVAGRECRRVAEPASASRLRSKRCLDFARQKGRRVSRTIFAAPLPSPSSPRRRGRRRSSRARRTGSKIGSSLRWSDGVEGDARIPGQQDREAGGGPQADHARDEAQRRDDPHRLSFGGERFGEGVARRVPGEAAGARARADSRRPRARAAIIAIRLPTSIRGTARSPSHQP